MEIKYVIKWQSQRFSVKVKPVAHLWPVVFGGGGVARGTPLRKLSMLNKVMAFYKAVHDVKVNKYVCTFAIMLTTSLPPVSVGPVFCWYALDVKQQTWHRWLGTASISVSLHWSNCLLSVYSYKDTVYASWTPLGLF